MKVGDRVQVKRECDEIVFVSGDRTPPGTIVSIAGDTVFVALDGAEERVYDLDELEPVE